MLANRTKIDLLCTGNASTDLRMRANLRLAMDGEKQPTFNLVAYNGGPIHTDSPRLDARMIIDLGTMTSIAKVAAILDHDDRQIVGQTRSVTIKKTSIEMQGVVTGDWKAKGDPAEKVVTHAKNGFEWPVSLGASIGGLDYLYAGESETINGKEFYGPLYIARRCNMRHISFLSDPADQTASARIAASGKTQRFSKGVQLMDFETWVKSLGFDPAELSEDQTTKLQAKFTAEQKLAAGGKKPKKKAMPPADADDADDDLHAGNRDVDPPPRKRRITTGNPLAEAKARRDRKNEIEKLMAQFGEDYPDAIEEIEEAGIEAIEDESWGSRDFENRLLRMCSRLQRLDNTPRVGTKAANEQITEDVIVAGLCRAGGMRDDALKSNFSDKALTLSEKKWRGGLTLGEMLEFTSRAHGFSGTLRSDTQDILSHAILDRRTLRAGANTPSTYDVSGILGSTMNRFVVDYFNAVDLSAMQAITAVQPVADFRQTNKFALTGDMVWEKVAPGGELKHRTFGETGYINQAETYGGIIGIDRRDLINDDLGALTRISQRMGRGGALTLLDEFWKVFINNSAFFTTVRGNLDTGTDTSLSANGLAALTLAKTLFLKQTDPDGKPVKARPRILLVPPELHDSALAIIRSTTIVMAGTAAAVDTRPATNVHSGTLTVQMSEELSNTSYTGASALKWYVLASPMDLPVIETCFLNGMQRPTVESVQPDVNHLGLAIRGYFDFGVALHEYRGGVAMAGE